MSISNDMEAPCAECGHRYGGHSPIGHCNADGTYARCEPWHEFVPRSNAPVGEDDMCPNCVTPWKCNGPHMASA